MRDLSCSLYFWGPSQSSRRFTETLWDSVGPTQAVYYLSTTIVFQQEADGTVRRCATLI
jgi:hypothetical protein